MRTKPFAQEDLTRDAFLGGKVKLWQPRVGYRAGVDPVFLAASIPAKAGDRVLELGCGAGPGLCCLGARVSGVNLTGVELQAGYAALAERNTQDNKLDACIVSADLRQLPSEVTAHQFHHVFANPPYFQAEARLRARDAGKEMGLAGETPLSDWVAVASRRSRPGGTVTFIQRADRLADVLGPMSQTLGSLEVLPLAPRQGRLAHLVLIRGRKEGRAPLRLHAPVILHQGPRHTRDAEDYQPAIAAVLRDGAAFAFPE
ncbi:MAG: methyltransferase [Rhodobacteraceae bacterium]|nr:methyltransferase [Paracoccaceae bacterium]